MREIPPEQSLIEYPSPFPIKVMGTNVDGFVEAVVAIAREFDPGLDDSAVETRPSRGNNYLGVTITVTNEATGLSRTVTVGSDGNYRIAQLPPGNYSLNAGGAPVAVNVSVGGTTSVNLGAGGAVELDTVQVMGSRVVNRVDVYSTESATNINREEVARMPVDQNITSIALLPP